MTKSTKVGTGNLENLHVHINYNDHNSATDTILLYGDTMEVSSYLRGGTEVRPTTKDWNVESKRPNFRRYCTNFSELEVIIQYYPL